VFFPDYYAPFYKLKAKKLVMFHDTFFWDTPQHYGRLWLKYFLWATKMGLRGNSSVFTITQFSKQKIGKIISPAIPIDFQHHPALQLWTSERLNTGILEGFDLKKNKYFLHVGVFEKRKDLPLLVEAFSQFKMLNKVHDYKLVLVGKRAPNKRFDDFHLIKSRIEKEPALAKDVILAGYLSKDKVQDLYQNALSYVFPSNNEGFGFPISESYINNCPVIVSNQGALTEVAGEAALTFKVGDLDDLVSQMSRIYLEPELREILIKNGKERLSLFEPRAYFNQFERYLTKMA